MKKQLFKKSEIRSMIREIIREALANKFGQGGDIEAAEMVANSHWGNVYLVMPKGEAESNVFYRVTLHNSSGPIKYLKQDQQGKWFFMDPPNKIWRPVNPAKVASANENLEDDPMDGDTTDVHTMDAVNVAEMTGTGAVGGYQTPYAFSKKSDGSKKAMDATEKTGYKKVKKAY